MNNLTVNYLSGAETWLFITTLIYFLMNGAQIFETAVIVPRWTASPPDSFNMFKGKYGLDFKAFWITLHCIHEITFIMAIIFCWQRGACKRSLHGRYVYIIMLILFAWCYSMYRRFATVELVPQHNF